MPRQRNRVLRGLNIQNTMISRKRLQPVILQVILKHRQRIMPENDWSVHKKCWSFQVFWQSRVKPPVRWIIRSSDAEVHSMYRAATKSSRAIDVNFEFWISNPLNLSYGYGSIPIFIPFLVGWTSINPSYFDVNRRGTYGFDTLPYHQTPACGPEVRRWLNAAFLVLNHVVHIESFMVL